LRISLVGSLASAERYPEALEAATQFARLPQVEPDQRRRFRQQAAAYLQELGRDADALTMYESAIKEVGAEDPKASPTFQRLAAFLTELGRLDEAEATWKRAERCARPGTMNWREVQIFRGRLLSKLERHSEALAVFNNLVADNEIGPTDRALALAELAIALRLAGQQDQAEGRSREAEALLQGETAVFIRGRLRLARGEEASGE
jgi:tetratricopeptide (TPR) repeat protein